MFGLARRHPRAAALLLACGLAGLVPAAVARLRPARLPLPTGPHRVGRVAYDWLDPTRTDVYARTPGVPRELPVAVWYPADPAPDARPAPYLPGWWAPTALLWGFDPRRVSPHAVPDAPVAVAPARYPVLVFSPPAFPPYYYTALCEELASHGYVVVGLSHTYETIPITVFADGRVQLFNPASVGGALQVSTRPHAADVRARAAVVDGKAADLRFVLDRLARLDAEPGPLAGRLDLARLGAFGHSLGGAAAAEVCRRDPRCRAGASLDGALWSEVGQTGVDQPFLQLFAEHREYVQPCADSVEQKIYASVEYCAEHRAFAVAGWQRLYTTAQPGYSIQLRGAAHGSFMDWGLLPLARWSPARRMLGPIAPERMWRLTSDYLLAFFDRHLRGAPAPLLDAPPPTYPEAIPAPPAVLFTAHESYSDFRRP